ncbi:MAG: gliding motility protein GldL [Bacteroidales bacterium]|nr:gliding motility protein GldL [Bacteroidales bacterium]
MTMLYGLGASIVIVGALFKINHYPGANIMLILGMGTEAIIFFFSAFEVPHVEPDWSLVFPELEEQFHGTTSDGEKPVRKPREVKQVNNSVSQELDVLLQNANIDNKVLRDLGEGFSKLNNTVSSLSDITSIGTAGKDLSESLRSAGKQTDGLAENIAGLNTAYETQIRKTNEQFKELAERMTQVFELQLKKTNEQNIANENIRQSMDKFVDSLQTAAKYNEQYQKESAALAKNLADLNKVYGNMLTAMNFNNNNK